MTILNLFMILISFALLLLCMLAPLRKSTAAQEHPSLKMLLRPHAVYGVLLLFVSLVHGILSGHKPAMMSGKAAWLGLICFFVPLLISLIKGTKGYCNRYCGRGQLFGLLGGTFGLSRKTDIPKLVIV